MRKKNSIRIRPPMAYLRHFLLAILLVGIGFLYVDRQSAQAQDALPSVSCPLNLGSCTANDVTTTVVNTMPAASDPTCSGPTDTIDVEITIEYESTSANRYDLGLFVATDGGSLSGTPAGDPQANTCVGAAALGGDGDINSDPSDADDDLFLNIPVDADSCGDLQSSAGPVQWTVSATVACDVESNAITLGSCRVWDQNTNNVCNNLGDAGTGSKCDCTPLVLAGLEFGTIEVIKILDPADDPGLFDLTIDGTAIVTDVGNGGTTGSIGVSAGGTYTVGEQAGTGTVLADYDITLSCTNGITTTMSSSVTVGANEAWVCTFTNSKPSIEPPDISVMKTVSPTFVSELGGPVTYEFEVTNDGISTVTLDSLIDSIYGDINGDGSCVLTQTLGPGESYNCSVPVTILDNPAGITITNIITATASNEAGTDNDSDDAFVEVVDTPSSILVIKNVDPGSLKEPGGLFTFTIEISNTSAIDSVDILTLTDSIYGDLDGQGDCSVPQTLPVDGAYSCSFSVVITENAGFTETDVITAAGIDDDDVPVDDDDDATITIVDIPSSIDVTKSASPANVPEPGGNVTFTVEVENTSAVDAVTITTITDTVYGDISASCMPTLTVTLTPGETITCTFVEFVAGNAGDTHENTATAAGTDDDGNPVSDSDNAIVTIDNVPSSIEVMKSADPTSISEPGGPVTFTIVVENTSPVDDVTLDTITDTVYGDITLLPSISCTPALTMTLQPGDTVACTFVEDVTGNAGDLHENTATASGTDDDGNPVSDDDNAEVTITDLPSEISVDKSANPTSVPEPGANVTFTVVVENTSAVDDVTITTITDTVYGDISASCMPMLTVTLAPGDTITCTFVEFVAGNADDVHENTATAAGTDDDGNPVSDSDDAQVTITDVGSDISVEKSASPTMIPEPGANVTFTVVVENESAVDDVTIDTITDTVYGDISTSCSPALPATLAPDDTITCTFVEFVDGEAGDIHENTVTAAGIDDDGNPVSDNDDATVNIEDVPSSIDVVKTASPTNIDEPGADVDFTVMVENTSAVDDVTIDAITDTVYSDISTSCSPALPATLAPGETILCTFTEFVAGNAGDIHENTATATGTDDDGNPVSDDDDAMVTIGDVPAMIEVTKNATPDQVAEPGGNVLFAIVVKNTSTVDTVEIITVTDTIYGDVGDFCVPSLPATLAPDQTVTCAFPETVSGNAGDTHTNVATAEGTDDDGNPVSDNDDETVTITDLPSSIEVTKSADPSSVDENGDDVTFTIVVENTSAVDDVDIITVTDTIYGDVSNFCAPALPATIAPGESVLCTFTEFVAGNAGDSHTNVATAEGTDDDGNPVSDDDDETVTITDLPSSIEVTKSADPTSVDEAGDDVTFTVVVENTSAVDAVDIITVTDTIYGDVSPSCSPSLPATLAPDETIVCTFTEFVSGAAGSTHTNVATAEGTDDDGNPVSDDDDETVTVTDLPSSMDVTKSASPTSVDEPGADVDFEITVENTSAVDVITVTTVIDTVYGDVSASCAPPLPASLAPGESVVCAFTQFVSGTVGSSHINVAEVTATDDDGNPLTGDDDAEVEINDIPSSIQVQKSASPSSVDETGGDVTFTVVVENTSAVDDVEIDSVVDTMFGDVSTSCAPALPATIAPGESVICTFTEFISGPGGSTHTNVATASGTDDDGNPVMDEDDAQVEIIDSPACLKVLKIAKQIFNGKKSTDVCIPESGGQVSYQFVVWNCSENDSITLDSIVDDNLDPGPDPLDLSLACGLGGDPVVLAPDEEFVCTINHVSLSGEPDAPHINTVTVTGTDDNGEPVSDDDSAEVPFKDVKPDINVNKIATPASIPEPGGIVTYTIEIVNETAEAVTLDTLVDDQFGDLDGVGSCTTGQIIPGNGTYTCSFTQFISANHVNIVTAEASDNDGNSTDDSDGATVVIKDVPGEIVVTKSAMPVAVSEGGGNVTFTIEIENVSAVDDVTLTTLIDSIYGDVTAIPGVSCTPALTTTLAPGDSVVCTFTQFISGMAGTSHTNVATAIGVDDDGSTVSDNDSETVTFTDKLSSIEVTKSADKISVSEGGEDVTFTIVVENVSAADDVTINTLDDSIYGDVTAIPGVFCTATLSVTLSPGDSFTCVFTQTVSGPAGTQHVNVATADGTDDDGNPVSGSDSETVTFTDKGSGIKVTKTADPVSVPAAGGDVTFVVEIENISAADSVTINSVIDSIYGDISTSCIPALDATITPGATIACTFTEFVSGTAGGMHENTATVAGVDDDGNPVSGSDTAVVDLKAPPKELGLEVTKLPDSQVIFQGETATFTITVENSGNITLTTTVVDPLAMSCDAGPLQLGPGQVETYSCSGSGYIADFTNVVMATGVAPGHDPITDTDDADVTVLEPERPNIVIVKEANPSQILVGDSVGFTITVQNTGNITLTGITVADPLAPDCAQSVPDLAPSASYSYACEVTDVLADFINVATATASSHDVSDDDDAPVDVINPGISITKSPDLQQIETGQVAEFTIVVSNTGDVALTNVTVSDPLAPNCNNVIGNLPVGMSESYNCDVLASDDFTNTASVTAEAPLGPDLTDEDDAVVELLDPSLTVIKAPSIQVLLPGETAIFTITVTNDGEVDINDVILADDLCDTLTLDSNGNGDSDLAVNEAWVYTCEIDNVTAKIFNTATASGTLASSGDPIEETSNEAEVNVFKTDPSIDVKKSTDTPVVYAGSTVTFTIEVLNDGDVPLSGINVIDEMCPLVQISNGDDDPLDQLAPGEVWVYQCVIVDIQDKFVNEVTATGLPLNGALPQVDDTDDERVDVIAPSLSIQKGPAKQTVIAGSDAVFEIEIKNDGNVLMTGVVVSDAQCDVLNPADTGPFDLAVDEVRTFTCTIENVTTELTNVASVIGYDPLNNAVEDTASADVNVIDPSIDVQKSPEKQVILGGTDVEFEIVVTNNGDVPLTDVVLDDPQCDPGTLFPSTPRTLQPGEFQSYTCSVSNVQDHFVNVATATGTGPNGTTVSDDDDARVLVYILKPEPSLDLSKSPAYQEIAVGQDAVFNIDVTNDGNVAIKDLLVADPMCDPLLLVDNGNGDIFLEVGETWTYQCTVPNVQDDFTNTAVAQGFTLKDVNKLAPAIADDSANVHVLRPAINVVKTPDKQTIPVGGTAEFNIAVTNKGPIALENVQLYDPKCKAIVKPTDTILDPGETWDYTCVKPHVEHSFINIAWASACIVGKKDNCIESEPDRVKVNVVEDKPPTISVSKKAGLKDDAVINLAGGPVTFYIHVANTSQSYDPVTITSLTDDIYGDLLDPANPNVYDNTCTAAAIAPGAAYACEFTANVDIKQVTDIVTVTAVDDEGESATANDDATVGLMGDVDCSKDVGAVDALKILRYDVGLIKIFKKKSCTLNVPSVNLYYCKFTKDQDVCGAVQAFFILRCDVGYNNILCPSTEPAGTTLDRPADAQGVRLSLADIPAGTDGTIIVPVHLMPDGGSVNVATLEVSYDSSVLRPVGCAADPEGLYQSAACNPAYRDGIARLSAVSSDGVDSGTKLADLTFEVVGELTDDAALTLQVVNVTGSDGVALPAVVEDGFGTLTQLRQMLFLPLILR